MVHDTISAESIQCDRNASRWNGSDFDCGHDERKRICSTLLAQHFRFNFCWPTCQQLNAWHVVGRERMFCLIGQRRVRNQFRLFVDPFNFEFGEAKNLCKQCERVRVRIVQRFFWNNIYVYIYIGSGFLESAIYRFRLVLLASTFDTNC